MAICANGREHFNPESNESVNSRIRCRKLSPFGVNPIFEEDNMSLLNFGSILGFAMELEEESQALFTETGRDDLAKLAKKHLKELARTRRENVTEMILETIEGFTREPFQLEVQGEESLKPVVQRNLDYYTQAAEKLKGQAEVARTLKTLAKKYKRQLDTL